MTIIVIPRSVQKELSDAQRFDDPLPGARYADIRVNERVGWLWFTAPTCWLPWNQNKRPKRRI